MKLKVPVTTLPTVGFNVETIKYKNFLFNVWVYFTDYKLYNFDYFDIWQFFAIDTLVLFSFM